MPSVMHMASMNAPKPSLAKVLNMPLLQFCSDGKYFCRKTVDDNSIVNSNHPTKGNGPQQTRGGVAVA